jgi:hypothetical protein
MSTSESAPSPGPTGPQCGTDAPVGPSLDKQARLAATAVALLRAAQAAADTHRPWRTLRAALFADHYSSTSDPDGVREMRAHWVLPSGTLALTLRRDLVPHLTATLRPPGAPSVMVYHGDILGLKVGAFRMGPWLPELETALAAHREYRVTGPTRTLDRFMFTPAMLAEIEANWGPMPE